MSSPGWVGATKEGMTAFWEDTARAESELAFAVNVQTCLKNTAVSKTVSVYKLCQEKMFQPKLLPYQ